MFINTIFLHFFLCLSIQMFFFFLQYRMHPEICKFPNTFYNNRLNSALNTSEPFVLRPYSVFNLNCLQSNNDMINYYNTEEANFIISMLKVMVRRTKCSEQFSDFQQNCSNESSFQTDYQF